MKEQKTEIIQQNSAVPMYKQIINILNQRIANGELKPGDKLPPEGDLVEQFKVSRITVRSALRELEETGLVVRSRGKGTFIASPKELHSANDDIGFTHSCLQEGKTPATTVLELSWIYPTIEDVEFLGVREDSTILCTKRLRYVDGEPTMIETNHYSEIFGFLEKEDLNHSLFDILQKHKITLGNYIRTIEVTRANSYEANLMNLKSGEALLLFTDKQQDGNGRPLFISRQLYCTERLKFYL